jgi:hypothetical protein
MPIPCLALIVALAAWLPSSGCRGHSWGGGTVSQGGFKEGVAYNYSITSLTHDGRVFFVLAADGTTGGSMTASENTRGTLHAADGREVSWSCATPDGTGGTVTVAGQQFDLAKGAVFLVSLKGNQTKVEQLAVDMSRLQGGKVEEELDAVGESEPRVKAFLKECRGEK